MAPLGWASSVAILWCGCHLWRRRRRRRRRKG
jgi:hypothetical protein